MKNSEATITSLIPIASYPLYIVMCMAITASYILCDQIFSYICMELKHHVHRVVQQPTDDATDEVCY